MRIFVQFGPKSVNIIYKTMPLILKVSQILMIA